jgi:nucleoid-associated protein YgaU
VHPVPDAVPAGPLAPDRGRPAVNPDAGGTRPDLPESLFDRVARAAIALWGACVDEDYQRLQAAATDIKTRLETESLI